jgi:DnaJ-class molecular chaperone
MAKKIKIRNKPGEIVKPGVLKTVKECGMPFFDAPYKFGNLYINFNIIFPTALDGNQKESLNTLFSALKQPAIKETVTETYTLSDYVLEQENTHHSGGKKEDRTEEGEDDEESEMRGGKRMGGCAHQ